MGDEKEGGWDIEATRQNYGRFRSSGRGAAEHGGPLEGADSDIEGDDDSRESPIGEGDGSARVAEPTVLPVAEGDGEGDHAKHGGGAA